MTQGPHSQAMSPMRVDHSVTAVSFYMNNIAPAVVSSQWAVLQTLAPSGFAFEQILTSLSHGAAINEFLASARQDLIVLLDIDCVPLTARALPTLVARAAAGALAGCVQRANHIQNGAHLYVGPFCMAFRRRLWEDLGRPSFEPTARGDVGEEFTYRCEAAGRSVDMLWPSFMAAAHWDLTDGRQFGPNTEYDGLFLHAFGIRDPANQLGFLQRCRSIVGGAALDASRA
jgi:Glycosyl transferase family 2